MPCCSAMSWLKIDAYGLGRRWCLKYSLALEFHLHAVKSYSRNLLLSITAHSQNKRHNRYPVDTGIYTDPYPLLIIQNGKRVD